MIQLIKFRHRYEYWLSSSMYFGTCAQVINNRQKLNGIKFWSQGTLYGPLFIGLTMGCLINSYFWFRY